MQNAPVAEIAQHLDVLREANLPFRGTPHTSPRQMSRPHVSGDAAMWQVGVCLTGGLPRSVMEQALRDAVRRAAGRHGLQ